jgi:hypothetical protein
MEKAVMIARELLLVLRRLRTFFQGLAVPDPAFSGVAGEFEILREFEGIDGACVFAEAAEHAAAQIIGKVGKFFAAGLFVARARYHDQILRTGQRAQIAGDAHGLVGIGIHIQPRRATVTLGHLRPLHGILLGIDFLGILIAEGNLQPLKQVDEKNFAEQVLHSHDEASISLARYGLPVAVSRVCAMRLSPHGRGTFSADLS